MSDYQVGQVLYVLPTSKSTVVPVQVVEEITKRTLLGSEISYMVRVGKDEETVDINNIDGEVYSSSDDVRQILIERSTTALNRIVNNATEKAEVWYGSSLTNDSNSSDSVDLKDALIGSKNKPRDGRGRFLSQVPPESDPISNDTTVQLPDGSVAKVKMPDVLVG